MGTEPSSDARDELLELSPREFEEFVAGLWRERGWETKLRDPGPDGGVDVVCRQHDPYERKLVIQAKRNQVGNTVGAPKVREYASLRRQETADEVAVVTTSSFTSGAEQLGDELNVKLVDGVDLVEMATAPDSAPSVQTTARIGADDSRSPDKTQADLTTIPGIQTIVYLIFVGSLAILVLWFLVSFILAVI